MKSHCVSQFHDNHFTTNKFITQLNLRLAFCSELHLPQIIKVLVSHLEKEHILQVEFIHLCRLFNKLKDSDEHKI